MASPSTPGFKERVFFTTLKQTAFGTPIPTPTTNLPFSTGLRASSPVQDTPDHRPRLDLDHEPSVLAGLGGRNDRTRPAPEDPHLRGAGPVGAGALGTLDGTGGPEQHRAGYGPDARPPRGE